MKKQQYTATITVVNGKVKFSNVRAGEKKTKARELARLVNKTPIVIN